MAHGNSTLKQLDKLPSKNYVLNYMEKDKLLVIELFHLSIFHYADCLLWREEGEEWKCNTSSISKMHKPPHLHTGTKSII